MNNQNNISTNTNTPNTLPTHTNATGLLGAATANPLITITSGIEVMQISQSQPFRIPSQPPLNNPDASSSSSSAISSRGTKRKESEVERGDAPAEPHQVFSRQKSEVITAIVDETRPVPLLIDTLAANFSDLNSSYSAAEAAALAERLNNLSASPVASEEQSEETAAQNIHIPTEESELDALLLRNTY